MGRAGRGGGGRSGGSRSRGSGGARSRSSGRSSRCSGYRSGSSGGSGFHSSSYTKYSSSSKEIVFRDNTCYINCELVKYDYPYDNTPLIRPSIPSDNKVVGIIMTLAGFGVFCYGMYNLLFRFDIFYIINDLIPIIVGGLFTCLGYDVTHKAITYKMTPAEEEEFNHRMQEYDKALALKNYRNRTVSELRKQEYTNAKAEGREPDYTKIVYPADVQDWVAEWYATHDKDGNLITTDNSEQTSNNIADKQE